MFSLFSSFLLLENDDCLSVKNMVFFDRLCKNKDISRRYPEDDDAFGILFLSNIDCILDDPCKSLPLERVKRLGMSLEFLPSLLRNVILCMPFGEVVKLRL